MSMMATSLMCSGWTKELHLCCPPCTLPLSIGRKQEKEELQDVTCRKPVAIKHYNANMGGVDIFDQLASSYHILRRSKKFNKVIFYDLLEIATINSYKLFAAWREANPGAIKRPVRYLQYEFREQLVRQLVNLPMHSTPLALEHAIPVPAADYRQVHSVYTTYCAGESARANWVVCWKQSCQRSVGSEQERLLPH